MPGSLNVMVVDDTITYRMIMKKVAESIPGICVTSTLSNGRMALDKLTEQITQNSRERPEVILLDVEMPVMDGLTTLKEVRKRYPQITVVMVSALSRSNANIIMECLNAGAMDFVTKPLETNVERAKSALRKELEPILALLMQDPGKGSGADTSRPATAAQATAMPATPSPPPPAMRPSFGQTVPGPRPTFASPPPQMEKPPALQVAQAAPGQPQPGGARKPVRPDLLLIGSSTGGPVALAKVLGNLGEKPQIPTLIVQHMPPVFTASLAEQLSRTSGLVVKEARDDQTLLPGSITIAQGGRHMTLQNRNGTLKLILNDGPKVNECRPAVDVLFMSVVASFTGNIVCVILTGMGRDGTNGVDALKRAGRTWCITQDKQSCVVYGMPRSVEEKGLSDESLPLDAIGGRITQLCNLPVAR
ncbi:MAG: chemotaxis-specific protein-glutamate methyltransferase CheB [Magnetococcales bacterium]|nr:chemotaxis-specific protein-glutamate methyltransferase CheB [Magnetococcales bacterium]